MTLSPPVEIKFEMSDNGLYASICDFVREHPNTWLRDDAEAFAQRVLIPTMRSFVFMDVSPSTRMQITAQLREISFILQRCDVWVLDKDNVLFRPEFDITQFGRNIQISWKAGAETIPFFLLKSL